MPIDTETIRECFEVMNRVDTIDKKLHLIYEWVKANHINLPEFRFLLDDLAIDMINKAASTK